MIRVALRGLAGRKLRATLTALAIILGVAMMSGTYVLTDTIDKAFSTIFDDSYAGTDVVVSGKGADISVPGHRRRGSADRRVARRRDQRTAGRRGRRGQRRRRDEHEDHRLRRQGDQHRAARRASASAVETGPDVDRFNPLNLVEGNVGRR